MKEKNNINNNMILRIAERREKDNLFIEKLIEYKKSHGGFEGITVDKELANKVNYLRRIYKSENKTRLSQEMIDKLNAIDFTWVEEYGQWFDSFYEKLLKYKEKRGSFFGLTKDKEIGSVVKNIRIAYKGKGRTKLTQHMIDKLDAIGFPWVVEGGQWFYSFFNKLEQYKDKNGNFVGINQDKKIGKQVSIVRQAYKGKGKIILTQEMIDQLNKIGFPWVAEGGYWFESFYEKLIAYKEQKGSFKGVTNDMNIGKTVSFIRQAHKGKGTLKLTQVMIDKLNAIGFPWEARPKKQKEDNLSI